MLRKIYYGRKICFTRKEVFTHGYGNHGRNTETRRKPVQGSDNDSRSAVGASLVALANLGYPFVGVGAYVVLFGASLGVWYRYPGRLFDERDERISARASDYTLMVFGYGAAVVFPALTLLYGVGRFEWTEFVAGAGSMLLAVFGVYYAAAAYLYRRS